jgi:hypothetical protein
MFLGVFKEKLKTDIFSVFFFQNSGLATSDLFSEVEAIRPSSLHRDQTPRKGGCSGEAFNFYFFRKCPFVKQHFKLVDSIWV